MRASCQPNKRTAANSFNYSPLQALLLVTCNDTKTANHIDIPGQRISRGIGTTQTRCDFFSDRRQYWCCVLKEHTPLLLFGQDSFSNSRRDAMFSAILMPTARKSSSDSPRHVL